LRPTERTPGTFEEARHVRSPHPRPSESQTASTSGKDLLRAVKRGTTEALAEFRQFHPNPPNPAAALLADAQLALARSYGMASWLRLVLACRVTNALCRDDPREVRALVTAHPELLVEDARGVKGNWGPPMS
jgi:hypothetical protein